MKTQHKDLILHLIIQDLLYHRMIYGIQKHEVHIEFYPDLATAVLQLMGYAIEAQEDYLSDIYNQFMAKVDVPELDSDLQVKAWAEECYLALASA
ncbi:MAG: hypothetical protein Roseis2KO_47670 [Roseivirga sp.]